MPAPTTTRQTRCSATCISPSPGRIWSPTPASIPQAVYTNAPPGGAFRGFGGPQGAYVAEMQMNKLAAVVGLDPVEIRRRNVLRDGSVGITGTELPAGVSLGEVVEACAAEAAWSAPPPEPRAVSVFASLAPSVRALRRGPRLRLRLQERRLLVRVPRKKRGHDRAAPRGRRLSRRRRFRRAGGGGAASSGRRRRPGRPHRFRADGRRSDRSALRGDRGELLRHRHERRFRFGFGPPASPG